MSRMMSVRRSSLYAPSAVLCALPIALCLLIATPAVAQTDEFPSKPIRIIVPLAAGGTGDKVFTVNVAEILEKGKTDTDLKLEPDDLIFVPERSIRF